MIIGVSGYNSIGTGKLFRPEHRPQSGNRQIGLRLRGRQWGDTDIPDPHGHSCPRGIPADIAIGQLNRQQRGASSSIEPGRPVFYNRHIPLTRHRQPGDIRRRHGGLDYVMAQTSSTT